MGCNPQYPHCSPPPDLNWVMTQLRCQMDRLNSLQNTVDKLVLTDNANTVRMTEIEMSFANLTLTVGEALNDIATLKGDTIILKQDMIIVKARVQTLEAAVDDLTSQLAALTERVNQNDAHDAQQDSEILALKVRVTSTENAATALNSTVQTIIQRVGALETNVTNLQIDNTSNKQQIGSLNGRMAGAEMDIDILQTAHENLSPRVAAVEIVAQGAQNGINGLTPRVGTLETSQATQDADISAIKVVNVQQGAAIVTNAQDVDALELSQHTQNDRLDVLEAGQGAQGSSIVGLTTRVTSVENRVTVIESNSASVSGLTTRVANLETDVADHDGRIVALEAGGGGGDPALAGRVTTLETSQGTQDAKISSLETSRTSHDTRITAADNKATAAQNNLVSVNATLALHDTALNKNGTDIVQLKTDTATTSERIDNFEIDIYGKYNDTQDAVNVLVNEVDSMGTRVDSAESGVQSMQFDVERIKNDYMRLTGNVTTNISSQPKWTFTSPDGLMMDIQAGTNLSSTDFGIWITLRHPNAGLTTTYQAMYTHIASDGTGIHTSYPQIDINGDPRSLWYPDLNQTPRAYYFVKLALVTTPIFVSVQQGMLLYIPDFVFTINEGVYTIMAR